LQQVIGIDEGLIERGLRIMAHSINIPNSRHTFPAILADMAAYNADRPFAHDASGGMLTWGDLQAATAAWADRFVTLGIRKGDIVTTILDANLESLALWLGLSSIGAIDATINSEFRGRMLAYAITTCSPSLIVIAQRYLPFLEAVAGELKSVKQVLVIGDDLASGAYASSGLPNLTGVNSLSRSEGAAAPYIVAPQWHDIACVTFTSGTTGPSKAVKIPWGQLNSINLGTFPFRDLSESDIVYCFTSHAHFGSKSIPYLAAMIGGQVVIRSRFSLTSFWNDIARFGITTASLVGTMADILMQGSNGPPRRTSLRNMFMAPLGPSYKKFAEHFNLRICTVYNSTELGVPLCSDWNPTDERTVGRLRRTYPSFEVRIVDEHDIEVPDGTPGECIVRPSEPWTLNAGYLNNPEATASAWRNGWFHTGDVLVRTVNGDYFFVDRVKDVIRRRGENISSFEVEADVKLNPDIAECAAIAVQARSNDDEILLFLSRRPGSFISAEEICSDLESRMARFMVPRYIEFIEDFPKTQATQRIIKAELRQRGIGPQTWDRELKAFIGDVGEGGRMAGKSGEGDEER
jgi:crotonobetaine/carnitine-CoA ligase